jgi:uncharacterized protein YegL
MKKDYTHITILLDRSGSMASVKDDTIGGLNQFLAEQKKVKGEATLTLNQFDDQYETVIDAADIQSAKPLTNKTFIPRGNTALLAAIGKSVDETGETIKNKQEHDRPEKVIFVIVTDGQENHSQHVDWAKDKTKAAISAKIKHQTEVYKWEFVFIGANQDAIAEAADIGIGADMALNYASNAIGTQALYASAGSNLRAVREGRKSSMSWTNDQRKEQDDAGAKSII